MTQNSFPKLTDDNNKVALVEGDDSYTYSKVNRRIDRFATGLLDGRDDLKEERIAFFMPASLDYVTAMHGIWRAGGIAIPLNVASAVAELDHYLTSAGVTRMIANGKYQESLRELCAELHIELVSSDDILADEIAALPEIIPERRGLMLFTSGTTTKPFTRRSPP